MRFLPRKKKWDFDIGGVFLPFHISDNPIVFYENADQQFGGKDDPLG